MDHPANARSKAPEATVGFWAIKILATTLGETGGDAVSMSMNLGYAVGTLIFATVFAATVAGQIRSSRFNAGLYWTTIVASTTLGTTLADFAGRSIGIGYPGGSALLLVLLLATLTAWHRMLGSVAIGSVHDARSEMFYWSTILFSQTLGTALGDWTADTAGLGYVGGMFVFAALLLVVAGCYIWSNISHSILFWTAFVLTRPLGAVVADFLDKPAAQGGLNLDRLAASAALLSLMAAALWSWPSRPARTAR